MKKQVIGRRIENLLALDYPPERLHILIGSDGSTDRTSEIVRLYRRPRIAFHDFALQRGKAQVLNDLVCLSRGVTTSSSPTPTPFSSQTR